MNRYEKRWQSLQFDPSKMPRRPPGEDKAREESDFLRFLGAVAPAAGAAIGGTAGAFLGGPAGAAAGMTLGSGAGSVVGAGLNYGADERTKKYDQFELERRARQEALRSYYAGALR